MNKHRNYIAIVLIAISCIYAGIDYRSNISGINGSYETQYKLYTSMESSFEVWSETQNVDYIDGNFNITLGSVNPLISIDPTTNYYIEIYINRELVTARSRIDLISREMIFAREIDDEDSSVTLEELTPSLEIGNAIDDVIIVDGSDFGIGLAVGADAESRLDVRGGASRMWDGTASVDYATTEGDLYVENDLEVDNTVYSSHYRDNAGGDLINGGSDITVSEDADGSWTVDFSGSIDDNDWTLTENVLFTSDKYGIARNGNILYGVHDSTHVNLGVTCSTGRAGSDLKYATVSGGLNNSASGTYSSVGGGVGNLAWNTATTVSGGFSNTAENNYSTVSGGNRNTASGTTSFVGAGSQNTASAQNSTVAGGLNNTASGTSSSIVGGNFNSASGNNTAIGGGTQNRALASSATISGGANNTINSAFGAIGGGYDNTVSGERSVIPGGSHLIVGDRSFGFRGGIGVNPSADTDVSSEDETFHIVDANFHHNYSNADADFRIDGASDNLLFGDASTDRVGIGTNTPVSELDVNGQITTTDFTMTNGATAGYFLSSDASGNASWTAPVTGSDDQNISGSGLSGTILTIGIEDGSSETVDLASLEDDNDWNLTSQVLYTSDEYGIARNGNTLHGDHDSTHVNLGVASASGALGTNRKYVTISGGYNNVATGARAVIGGGEGNFSNANASTVGGGLENTAAGGRATISGGYNNSAYGNTGTIGGGETNSSAGDYSFVGGGLNNTASGTNASVTGGQNNTASGNYSIISGGRYNTTSGGRSVIPGGSNLTVGNRSFGFRGGIGGNPTNFVDVSAYDETFHIVDANFYHNYTRADADFRVDGTSIHLIFGDASTNRVGIGTAIPTRKLDVDGQVRIRGGSPTIGHVLTAISVDGSATWQAPAGGSDDQNISGSGLSGTILTIGIEDGSSETVDLASLADDNDWTLIDSTLFTSGEFSIARAGNTVHLDQTTHVNLGVACTTGHVGFERMYATVGGGHLNVAGNLASTVSGGDQNKASGAGASVLGGLENIASNTQSSVTGGRNNTASGARSIVGGGTDNTASGSRAVVSGGGTNTAGAQYSVVSGGYLNQASQNYASVGGGSANTVTGQYGVISGGQSNSSSNDWGVISGGSSNVLSGDYGVIAGGLQNNVSQNLGAISGGRYNRVGRLSAIPGGSYLTVGDRSFGFRGGIGSNPSAVTNVSSEDETFHIVDAHFHHNFNNANADFRVDGASDNLLFGDASTDRVGIGTNTPASELDVDGQITTTDFTMTNGANAGYILSSDASGNASWTAPVTGTDDQNISGSGLSGTILTIGIEDGSSETVDLASLVDDDDWTLTGSVLYTSDEYGIARDGNTLIGDNDSTHVNLGVGCTTGDVGLDRKYIAIGGGWNNVASGGTSTIAGGRDNTASNGFAAIGGGRSNTASGSRSVVAGGGSNIASGEFSAVGGGGANVASGVRSVIPGGSHLIVGARSFGFRGGIGGDPSSATDVSSEIETFHIVDANFHHNYSNANADFRVDGASDNLLFGDASTDRVGIGTDSPTSTLDINGTIRIRGGTPAVGDVLTCLTTEGTAEWQPHIPDAIWEHVGTSEMRPITSTVHVRPYYSNDSDLGTATHVWRNVYATRYFDGNNPGFYVDPHSTSILSGIDVRNSIFSNGPGAVTIFDDLVPAVGDSFDLGSGVLEWDNLWLNDKIYVRGSEGAAGQVLSSGGSGGSLTWTTPASGAEWYDGGGYLYTGEDAETVRPYNANNADLGTSSYYWRNVYATRYYDANNTSFYLDPVSTSVVNEMDINSTVYNSGTWHGGDVAFADDIVPNGNAAQNLGSSSINWGNLYMNGRIYLANNAGTVGQVLTSNGSGASASWQTPGGDSDWTVSGSNQYSAVSGNVGIGTSSPAHKLHVNKTLRTDDVSEDIVYIQMNHTTNDDKGVAHHVEIPAWGDGSVTGYEAETSIDDPHSFNGSVLFRGLDVDDYSGGGNAYGGYGQVAVSRLYNASAVGFYGFVNANSPSISSTGTQRIAGVFGRIAGTINEGSSSFHSAAVFGQDIAGGTGDHYAGYFEGDVRITQRLFDSSGDAGTSGQILSASAAGTDWIDASSGDTDWTIGSGVIYNSGNEVAIGTTTSDGHGLNVEHYSAGTAAVRGSDGTGTVYAEGLLGVLSYPGLPLSLTNIGVLGIKPANGARGAAVYAWNNDDNGINYAVYANANGSTGTNYGIYSSASGGTTNYAGFFNGNVRITGRIYDSSGDVGTSGQVLTSTGTGTNWATGGVTGSGTSGRNARWTGTTTLGNSAMYDNGSQISVGTTVNTDYQIYGYETASGDMAVYGRNAYSTDHYGYLGGSSYGVYGAYDGGRYGYLGGNSYGVYGYYSSTSYGYLGSSSDGVYGRGTYGVYSLGTSYGFYTSGSMTSYGIYCRNSSSSTGDHSIYGYQSTSTAATSYAYNSTIAGVVGYVYYGQAYHFGVYGLRDDDSYGRSGGVFGSCDNDASGDWGSLGYQSSGTTEYGGYFYGGYAGGSGFFARTIEDASANILAGMDGEPHINVGVGSWGDLFGADIHGNIYGTFTEGGRYSSYDHGDRYVDGLDIHLQKSDTEQNSILYTNVSTDVSVQASGFGRLESGTGRVEFDDNFSNVISHEVPVVVTVTPIGNCKGVYISELSNNGFSVSEVGDGESSVQFTWIALGRRAGFEDPQLPTEVTSSDYVEKIRDGLRPDGDLSAGDGSGLYFLNGELNAEVHASCLPNEERLALKKQLSEKPESKTWEEWTEAFRAFGDETPPITIEQFESHIEDKKHNELMEQEAQSHAQNVETINK